MGNPFAPGFARRPPRLVGRAPVLTRIDSAGVTVDVDHATPPVIILVGPRGVGKTVLLAEARERLGARYGWASVAVEASRSEPLAVALGRRVQALRQAWGQGGSGSRPRRWRAGEARVEARLPGIAAGATFARTVDEPALDVPLDRLLVDAAEEAAARDTALVHAPSTSYSTWMRPGWPRSGGR